MAVKQCSKCGRKRDLSDFGPEKRSADGHRYSCRDCDRKRHQTFREANRVARNEAARLRRQENPERDREYSRNYRRRFVWRTVLQHARKRAAKFGWKYDLDSHLPKIQARLDLMTCEMTGAKLVVGVGAGSQGQRYWNTPSLDRIDPTKGYTYSNIRVVCWAMNCAMGTWGEEVLRELVTAWLNKE